MTEENRMTALNASVGADDRRSLQICSDASIDENDAEIKSFEEMQLELLRMADPSYLKTVSMTELFDNVYQSRPPVIDGLLYRGMYLFVGAPKLGKSFLMGQIAYHVSTGTPLWGFPLQQGTVLYLALEDDYGRLQERLYRMFGTSENEKLFFSVSAKQLGSGLDEQLTGFLREHPDTSLIIIDTLQKVREIGGDNYSYANDYQIITRLKTFADTYGICLMVVHHTRKQKADYTVDKEPTCTEEGSKSIHCKHCDAVKDSTVIPAKGHAWDSGVIIKQATATEAGQIKYTCTRCGEVKYVTIPPTESPKTGDESHMGLWIALMCASVTGIAVLVISSKKRKAGS